MKESKLKISVIVATYNQEKFIGRCLRSLLHQTLPHAEYEIVVINDGSNDKTGFALELFCDHNDSIVKVLTNKSNVGLPSSLNRGLENAKGKYIVRVDSDDFVNTNFLNFLLCYIETNKSADAVACDYLLLDDRENELKRCNCEKEPIACGILFKKEHLFNIGLYDEKFRIWEEKDLRIRFNEKYKIERLNIPLYRYRRHDKNLTDDVELTKHYQINLEKKHKIKIEN